MYDDNPDRYRTALRLLAERRSLTDAETVEYLRGLALSPQGDIRSLRALWGLQALAALDTNTKHRLLGHPYAAVRAWTVRFLSEQTEWSDEDIRILQQLSQGEPVASVRLEIACALRRIRHGQSLEVWQTLALRANDTHDTVIPFMLWLAWEAQLSHALSINADAQEKRLDRILGWLAEHAGESPILVRDILPRTMRRLLAENPNVQLARCLNIVHQCREITAQKAALRGILEGLKGRSVQPPENWHKIVAELNDLTDSELPGLINELGIVFRDPRSIHTALNVLRNTNSKDAELLHALQSLAVINPTEALPLLRQRWQSQCSDAVRLVLLRNLANYDDPAIASMLIDSWKQLSPAVRAEVIKTLQRRRAWARALLEAVARKQIPVSELHSNTVLAVRAFQDAELNRLLEKVWGQVRETPAEVEKKIEQFRLAMYQGRGDPDRGRAVYEKHCAQCHRFRNQGHEVGPDLDGAERSVEYLLINILDPNRVVGQPYFTRLILTKDGKVLTGLLAQEDAESITIRRENNVLETVPKTQIEQMKVETRSLMPENLDQNISEQGFRDLIAYLVANPFVTEVYVAGPIRPDAARLDRWLANKMAPVEEKGLVWQTPPVGPAGRILIPLAKYDLAGRDVSYIYAEIENKAAMKTELRVSSTVAYRIWLDGRLLLTKEKPTPRVQQDEVSVPVELSPGRHRLLIEALCLDRPGEIYVCFHDPQRQIQQIRVPGAKP
ncbi:hypothetical protein HRbin36_02466 [bacterium HR36]|nr:hypothetical protein HRbin36_02466 [bacterium HR36]